MTIWVFGVRKNNFLFTSHPPFPSKQQKNTKTYIGVSKPSLYGYSGSGKPLVNFFSPPAPSSPIKIKVKIFNLFYFTYLTSESFLSHLSHFFFISRLSLRPDSSGTPDSLLGDEQPYSLTIDGVKGCFEIDVGSKKGCWNS